MSQLEQRTLNSQSATLRNALLALIPSLRAFAFSLTGDSDRADDLVQDTLLKAWGRFDNFQEGTHLRAWLFTIQRNTFFSECRRRRHVSEDPDGQKANALCVHAAQGGHMDMQDFRRALDAVPPEQREALMLVAAAGFSCEEAAAIVGCAIGTIKSRVHRARCKLMEVLEMDAPRQTRTRSRHQPSIHGRRMKKNSRPEIRDPSVNRGLMRFHKAKRVSAIEAKWIIAEAPSSLSETIAICHDENWYDVRLMTKHELQEFVLDLLRDELAALQSGQMIPH